MANFDQNSKDYIAECIAEMETSRTSTHLDVEARDNPDCSSCGDTGCADCQ